MRVKADFSGLRQAKWYEYALRFFFGGLITACAGVIAKYYGPGIGGLFLAFPAIFPASATLIEKHEREKKEKLGLHGQERGIKAASIDAAGAAIGSVGLLVFGFMVSRLLVRHTPWMILPAATLAWLALSIILWKSRKSI